MIKRNTITNLNQITSMDDDPWYQAATDRQLIFAAGDDTPVGAFAAASMTDTLFWIKISSGTWRITVNSEHANEFLQAIEAFGPEKVIRFLKE